MGLYKRENRHFRRMILIAAAILIVIVLSSCNTAEKSPAETSTSEIIDTRELFSAGLNEDGTLKNINPKDYIKVAANYKHLNIPKDKWKVQDKDVDEQIKAIMSEYSVKKKVKKRKIKKGDLVRVSYKVLVDGEAIPEETVSDFDLVIGSGVFETLENGLKQKKPGKISIDFTLPDPYENDESLSGKDAVIKADVKYIIVTETPELTDAFVKKHFKKTYGASTTEDFRKAVLRKMRAAKRGNLSMQTVLKKSQMKEIPDQLVNDCIERYIAQQKNRAEQSGMTFPQYLSKAGYANEEAMREAIRKSCEDEASLYILIDYIASKEGIKVEKDDLAILSYGDLTTDKLREFYPDAYLNRQILNLKVRDKVVEYNRNSNKKSK